MQLINCINKPRASSQIVLLSDRRSAVSFLSRWMSIPSSMFSLLPHYLLFSIPSGKCHLLAKWWSIFIFIVTLDCLATNGISSGLLLLCFSVNLDKNFKTVELQNQFLCIWGLSPVLFHPVLSFNSQLSLICLLLSCTWNILQVHFIQDFLVPL